MKHMNPEAKVVRALLIVALGPGTPELVINEHESINDAKNELKDIYIDATKDGKAFEGTQHSIDWTWALVFSDDMPLEMRVYEL